jgi:hypothetical protein
MYCRSDAELKRSSLAKATLDSEEAQAAAALVVAAMDVALVVDRRA